MIVRKILMSFDNVSRKEKRAQITLDGKKYVVSVTVDPFSYNVLCSIYLDREPIVLSRLPVMYEPIIGTFGVDGMEDSVLFDFMFLPDNDNRTDGNQVDYRLLGNGVELYAVDRGDYYKD